MHLLIFAFFIYYSFHHDEFLVSRKANKIETGYVFYALTFINNAHILHMQLERHLVTVRG